MNGLDMAGLDGSWSLFERSASAEVLLAILMASSYVGGARNLKIVETTRYLVEKSSLT